MADLKVAVKDQPTNLTAIDATASNLAAWLKTQGRTVDEIRIPPPELHPHQSQMNSILVMLLIFSLMALGLSAILTATMINGLLAQQIRQIGIMKAIGARSSQITSLYLIFLVVVLGLVAVVIGVPLGVAAGRGFAEFAGDLLNFTITSYDIPLWVYIVELPTGILIRCSSHSIRFCARRARRCAKPSTITAPRSRAFGSRGLDSFLGKLRGIDNTLLLAIRNTFRRRGRLLLTLGLRRLWRDVHHWAQRQDRLGNLSRHRRRRPSLRSGNSLQQPSIGSANPIEPEHARGH